MGFTTGLPHDKPVTVRYVMSYHMMCIIILSVLYPMETGLIFLTML